MVAGELATRALRQAAKLAVIASTYPPSAVRKCTKPFATQLKRLLKSGEVLSDNPPNVPGNGSWTG